MPEFVHLRLHTEFSLRDSVVRVPELMQAVAARGMPAVALTDAGNLFAMVKFYREALQQGIKPLIGVDLLIREAGERAQPSLLTLLCMDEPGYKNLTRLVTRAFLEGQQRSEPMLARDWLDAASTAGLIALSGGRAGDVGRALTSGKPGEADRLLEHWLRVFGDRYYLEVARLGRAGDEALVGATVQLAARQAVPLVARDRRDREDGLSRLLPDRRRFHQMGEGSGDSRRAGPRLGRGFGGRVGADHYRSRSLEAGPAVRTLPEP
jgi:DNA polymerase III subunit alpha